MPDSFPEPLPALLATLAGLLIGSFLNVCIYRIPRDLSVVKPRSYCPECLTPIAAYDNIPIFSFLLLRGRCRKCGHAIGTRYVAVEIGTALLFGSIVWRYGWSVVALKWLSFVSLQIILFCTDLEVRILPDEFTLGGSILGLVFAAFVPVPGELGPLLVGGAGGVAPSLLNAALGSIVLAGPLWLLGIVYGKLRRRDALGLGDVKLLAALGSFLGPGITFQVLMAGAIAGSIVGVGWAVWTRRQLATLELPLGSFLCAAAVLVPFLA